MMRAAWLACVLSIAIASSAAGQIAGRGSLQGRVTDGGRFPVSKVVVTATNEAGECVATAVTDGRGFYWLPSLPPGNFVIAARGQGVTKTVDGTVRVRTDTTRVVDIVLAPGEATDTGTTTSPAPTLDTTGATASARTTGDFLRQLPLSRGSSYADALFLAPGIASQQTGRSFVHGASPESTLVFIDGFEMTSNLQAGTAYTQLGVEAVDDIEVKTASMDASIPLTQAAVINVATRAATNSVHGTVGVVAGPRPWMANNTAQEPGRAARFFQLEGSGGGALRADRWWLYVSGRAGAEVMQSSIVGDQAAMMRSLQSAWTAEDPSALTASAFLKITGQPSSGHQLTAFVQTDAATTTSSSVSTGASLNSTAGGSAYGARWSAAWPGLVLTQASVSYNNKTANVDSSRPEATALRVYRSVTTTPGGIAGSDLLGTLNGSTGCCTSQPASNLTANVNLTWLRPARRGSHEIGVGAYLQPRLRVGRVMEFNNNGFHVEEAVLRDATRPSAGFVPFHRLIFDQAAMRTTDLAGGDSALYLQDRWQASGRLTLAAGLRVDWINESDRLTGRQLLDTRAIGPRVSVAYRLTPRDVLRGGWGRVHEALSAARYVSSSHTAPGMQQSFDTDLDGVFETVQHYDAGTVADTTAIDVRRSQPYVNEWTIDYGRQVGGSGSVGVALVRREFRSMPVQYYAPTTTAGRWTSQMTVAADTWNYPVVTDLTVRAAGHAGRVQFTGSYTYNFRHVAGTWLPNDPASIYQPDSFPNDRGIGVTSVATSNSLIGLADTSNEAWVDHSLRLAAVWTGPRGLGVAGYYEVQSGPWSGPIVVAVDNADPSRPARQLVGPTRGDGQLQLGALQLLNLRASYRVRSEGVTIDSAVDVFNPFNWDGMTAFQPGANWSGTPLFGVAAAPQWPRAVQLSVRVVF